MKIQVIYKNGEPKVKTPSDIHDNLYVLLDLARAEHRYKGNDFVAERIIRIKEFLDRALIKDE